MIYINSYTRCDDCGKAASVGVDLGDSVQLCDYQEYKSLNAERPYCYHVATYVSCKRCGNKYVSHACTDVMDVGVFSWADEAEDSYDN
jgi:ribosomal protein S14